jgi:hypothetical protein
MWVAKKNLKSFIVELADTAAAEVLGEAGDLRFLPNGSWYD